MEKSPQKESFDPKTFLGGSKADSKSKKSRSFEQGSYFKICGDTAVKLKNGSATTVKELLSSLSNSEKVDCHCLHPEHADENPSAFLSKQNDQLFHCCMSCGQRGYFPEKSPQKHSNPKSTPSIQVPKIDHSTTLANLNHGYGMPIKQLMNEAIDALPQLEFDDVEAVAKEFIIQNITQNLLFTVKIVHSKLCLYAGGKWHQFKDSNEVVWFIRKLIIKSLGVQLSRLRPIVNAILEELEIDILLPVESEGKVYINCETGVLVVNQGKTETIPHDQRYGFTYILEHNYDPEVDTTEAFNFFLESIEEPEAVQVLFEFLGSCFIPSDVLNMEKIVIFYGDGGSGKSTLQKLIWKTLGKSHISNVELHEFTDDNKVQTTIGCILNLGTEINHRKIDPSTIKKISSNEPMTVNVKYKDAMVIEQYPKIICATNNLPTTTDDTSMGYFRRFMIFSFDKTFNYDEQDLTFNDRLQALLPAILKLIIEGAQRLLHNGKFTYSAKIEAANKRFMNDVDSVRAFVEERRIRLPKQDDSPQFTSGKTLYSEYEHYCSEQGLQVHSKNQFLRSLQSLGFKKFKSGNDRGYRAIIERPEASIPRGSAFGQQCIPHSAQGQPWAH